MARKNKVDLFGEMGTENAEAPKAAAKPRRRTSAEQAPSAEVATALEKLPGLIARLEEMIGEVPRAAEFEPLAEHIYSFAQSGPKLMESLEAVKAAVPQIEAATAALSETATTLQDTNQRLSESLLRLPSAEDYEPLATPLVEFTKVSPALTETMRDAVRSFSSVRETVARLETTAKSFAASTSAAATPIAPPPKPARGPKGAVEGRVQVEIAETLETLANEIDGTLVKLPKDPEYGRVAEQLRELATVSPSLMEWMKEVKPLAAPLAGSVVTLRRVATTLRENAARLRGDKT